MLAMSVLSRPQRPGGLDSKAFRGQMEGILRLGTLNVQTIKGKLTDILFLAETYNLDMLCRIEYTIQNEI